MSPLRFDIPCTPTEDIASVLTRRISAALTRREDLIRALLFATGQAQKAGNTDTLETNLDVIRVEFGDLSEWLEIESEQKRKAVMG